MDDHLPDYPGFQKDVFKVIKDYFDSQAEPLLTFNMYEAFANVVGECFDMCSGQIRKIALFN